MHFNGQSNIKNRPIDTVILEFDQDRNKYLPKQMQLELKLVYRTGKINIKVYPFHLNEFNIVRNGVKSKLLKVYERLYSLQCSILAKADGTESAFLQSGGRISQIKSQQNIRRPFSRQRDSMFGSKSPDPVVKYVIGVLSFLQTISEKIKVTSKGPKSYSKLNLEVSEQIQQKQKTIIKEEYEEYSDDGKSCQGHDETLRNNRPKIFNKTDSITPKKISNFSQMPSSKGSRQNNMQKQNFINEIKFLQSELDKEKSFASNYLKEIKNLRNKIEHLYHEKNLISREKEEDKEIFLSKDKQQKIRQKRQMDQLRRKYEREISTLNEEIQRIQNQNINSSTIRQLQQKCQRLNTLLQVTTEQLEQYKFNFKLSQETIEQLQCDLADRNSSQVKFREQRDSYKRQMRNSVGSSQGSMSRSRSRRSVGSLQQNVSDSELADDNSENLLNLVDRQTQAYHEMITKLEGNIGRLEVELNKLQEENNNMMVELETKTRQLDEADRVNLQLREEIDRLQRENTELSSKSSLRGSRLRGSPSKFYGNGGSGGGSGLRKSKVMTTFSYRPQHSILYTPMKKVFGVDDSQNNIHGHNDRSQFQNRLHSTESNSGNISGNYTYTTYSPSADYGKRTASRGGVERASESENMAYFGDYLDFATMERKQKEFLKDMESFETQVKSKLQNAGNVGEFSYVESSNHVQNGNFEVKNSTPKANSKFQDKLEDFRGRAKTVMNGNAKNTNNRNGQNAEQSPHYKKTHYRSVSEDSNGQRAEGNASKSRTKKRFVEDIVTENFKITEEEQEYLKGQDIFRKDSAEKSKTVRPKKWY